MIPIACVLRIYINFGNDDPGSTLRRRERGSNWMDYLIDDEQIKSPIDIDELPFGECRLVE